MPPAYGADLLPLAPFSVAAGGRAPGPQRGALRATSRARETLLGFTRALQGPPAPEGPLSGPRDPFGPSGALPEQNGTNQGLQTLEWKSMTEEGARA